MSVPITGARSERSDITQELKPRHFQSSQQINLIVRQQLRDI